LLFESKVSINKTAKHTVMSEDTGGGEGARKEERGSAKVAVGDDSSDKPNIEAQEVIEAVNIVASEKDADVRHKDVLV
jgi:hypothetical protein